MTPTEQRPRDCALHRRIKGISKCVKTWQGCILCGMHIGYCPDFAPKTEK